MPGERYHLINAATGHEITGADRQRIQENARSGDYRYQDSVQNMPEYAEYFQAIDFKLIDSIIKKILASCGIVDDPRLNLSLEKIFLCQGGGQSFYNSLIDKMSINKTVIDEKKDQRSKVLAILPILVHEYFHSLSYINVAYETDAEARSSERNGFYEVKHGVGEDETYFKSLEEGLTETLARQVVREYLTAVGETKFLESLEQADPDEIAEKKHYHARETQVAMVRYLAEFISTEAGVNAETVLQAMVREKFTGENPVEIWRELLIEFLGEEQGEIIYDLLARASDSNAIDSFIHKEIDKAREIHAMSERYNFKMPKKDRALLTINGTVHEVGTKREAAILCRTVSLEEVNAQGEMEALVATMSIALKSDLPTS